MGKKSGHAVGVVRDFHIKSLQHAIEPMVMHYWAQHTITVRVSGVDLAGALAHLESTWGEFLPGIPFEYWFVDQNLALFYQSERSLNETCVLFSFLAVFIACLPFRLRREAP